MRLPGLDELGDLTYVQGGGMASLYHGRVPEWGEIAVKVPRRSANLERFRRELEIMLAVAGHPRIVHTFDGRVQERAEGSFMAMEWVPFPTLGDALEETRARGGGGFPWPVVAAIGHAVCGALRHAYGTARVRAHRDIKPNNIFADIRGEAVGDVKLTDFGIAAPREETRLTRQLILGRPEYIAPERTQPGADARIDERADVYSLGAVMYECLCGSPPYTGDDDFAVLAAILRESAEPIGRRCPELDPEAAELVMRCLARSPDERPDVGELEAELAAPAAAAARAPRQMPASEERPAGATAPPRPSTAVDVLTPGATRGDVTGTYAPEPGPPRMRPELLAAGLTLLFFGALGVPAVAWGLYGYGALASSAAVGFAALGALLLGGGGVAMLGIALADRKRRARRSGRSTRSIRSPAAELEPVAGLGGGAVPLWDHPITCGRDPGLDVRLPETDLEVSRVHANLLPRDGGFVLENRGRNGTEVNDELVTATRPLEDGDRIRMGSVELVFRASPAAATGGGDGGSAAAGASPAGATGAAPASTPGPDRRPAAWAGPRWAIAAVIAVFLLCVGGIVAGVLAFLYAAPGSATVRRAEAGVRVVDGDRTGESKGAGVSPGGGSAGRNESHAEGAGSGGTPDTGSASEPLGAGAADAGGKAQSAAGSSDEDQSAQSSEEGASAGTEGGTADPSKGAGVAGREAGNGDGPSPTEAVADESSAEGRSTPSGAVGELAGQLAELVGRERAWSDWGAIRKEAEAWAEAAATWASLRGDRGEGPAAEAVGELLAERDARSAAPRALRERAFPIWEAHQILERAAARAPDGGDPAHERWDAFPERVLLGAEEAKQLRGMIGALAGAWGPTGSSDALADRFAWWAKRPGARGSVADSDPRALLARLAAARAEAKRVLEPGSSSELTAQRAAERLDAEMPAWDAGGGSAAGPGLLRGRVEEAVAAVGGAWRRRAAERIEEARAARTALEEAIAGIEEATAADADGELASGAREEALEEASERARALRERGAWARLLPGDKAALEARYEKQREALAEAWKKHLLARIERLPHRVEGAPREARERLERIRRVAERHLAVLDDVEGKMIGIRLEHMRRELARPWAGYLADRVADIEERLGEASDPEALAELEKRAKRLGALVEEKRGFLGEERGKELRARLAVVEEAIGVRTAAAELEALAASAGERALGDWLAEAGEVVSRGREALPDGESAAERSGDLFDALREAVGALTDRLVARIEGADAPPEGDGGALGSLKGELGALRSALGMEESERLADLSWPASPKERSGGSPEAWAKAFWAGFWERWPSPSKIESHVEDEAGLTEGDLPSDRIEALRAALPRSGRSPLAAWARTYVPEEKSPPDATEQVRADTDAALEYLEENHRDLADLVRSRGRLAFALLLVKEKGPNDIIQPPPKRWVWLPAWAKAEWSFYARLGQDVGGKGAYLFQNVTVSSSAWRMIKEQILTRPRPAWGTIDDAIGKGPEDPVRWPEKYAWPLWHVEVTSGGYRTLWFGPLPADEEESPANERFIGALETAIEARFGEDAISGATTTFARGDL